MRLTQEREKEIRDVVGYDVDEVSYVQTKVVKELLAEIDRLREVGKEHIYQHACRLDDECKKTKELTRSLKRAIKLLKKCYHGEISKDGIEFLIIEELEAPLEGR